MNVLDAAFPPDECIHEAEAERYVTTGYWTEQAQVPYYPVYGYISPEMMAQAYSLA